MSTLGTLSLFLDTSGHYLTPWLGRARRDIMRNGYLLEIDHRDAALLVREGDAYAFLAISTAFQALDGKLFSCVTDAERAARRLIRRNSLAPAA
ncbi:MAG: hypothetical protein P4L98_02040 [Ancalomicrobiaceae bacterium]|nr:hypothetical protein [Ancalomicrobiaceae bacterium]